MRRGSFKSGMLGAVLLPMLLPACGGGSGSPAPSATGGAGGAGGISAPAPSPSPTAAAGLPPVPFGLTANTPFALTGYQYVSDGNQPAVFAAAEDKGVLAWSADLRTYTMALADLGSGRLAYTFPGNNPYAFSLIRADGTRADVYATVIVHAAAIGEVYWQSADGIRPFVYAHALFGIAPAPGSLPTSGRRIFLTDSLPERTIAVDFAARTVNGSLTAMYNGPFDEGPEEVGTLQPAELRPDGSFTARFTVAGATEGGELRGRLMGAGGNELAVHWNGPSRLSSSANSPFETHQTVMYYSACTSCPG